MKIVCIGNSNVNGFPHRRSQCFASILREITDHKIINKGVNGACTEDILERFENDVVNHHPDAVIILTGTNDFLNGKCEEISVLNQFKKMVNICEKNNIKPIICTPALTDPEMAAGQWIPGVDYEEVNEALRALRQQLLDYKTFEKIDVFDLQNSYDCDYVDGVHFTLEGHKKIAEMLAEFLKKAA